MIKILLYITLMASCSSNKNMPQKEKEQMQILNAVAEIKIYNFFEDRGFTNGNAYSYFDKMSKMKISKSRIEDSDMNLLLEINSKAKVKNLFPGKVGQEILFTEFVYTDNSVSKIIIQTNLIRDFTNHIDYWIEDIQHQQLISQLKDKMFENYQNKEEE